MQEESLNKKEIRHFNNGSETAYKNAANYIKFTINNLIGSPFYILKPEIIDYKRNKRK